MAGKRFATGMFAPASRCSWQTPRDVAGSNIFLLILVLGISAFFSAFGLRVSSSVTHIEVPILLAVKALVVLLFLRHPLHSAAGTGLLAFYCGYIAYIVARGG